MTISPVWTITASGIGGGSQGKLLVGCHITINAEQTAYEFTKPNINDILAISSGTTLPVTFPSFNYKGFIWSVTLVTAPVGATATGTWVIATAESEELTPDSGDFAAQFGLVGVDEEEAASSAHT